MSHVFAGNEATADGLTTRRDAFYWRFICTAFAFFTFAVGALLLSLTVMPVLRILPRERCQHAARAVLQRGMRLYVRLMHRVGGMTYEVRGLERLGRPGQLILANHPTLIDALFLIAFIPQPLCVAKAAMFRNPLTRNVVKAAGYISNASTADMITTAAAALAAGQCLIMFPEGTRTSVRKPLVFQRGAANIAVRAAATVTPVYIRCEPITLTKGEPWYRIPLRRPHFSLQVGEDFPEGEFRPGGALPRASRLFNERLQVHFERELQQSGGYTPACGTGTQAPMG